MPKLIPNPSNYRVIIYPESWHGRRPTTLAQVRQIEEQVKRHIDDVSHTDITYDQEPVCEYCKAVWTEKSKFYNGGCCDKDEDGNPENTEMKNA